MLLEPLLPKVNLRWLCYRPSVCRPSVICRLSVCRLDATFVRPTQPVEIFGNFSPPFGTLAIH